MANRIQIRRDTATNWLSVNPTLTQGELGLELDTGKLKVGNGLTAWSTLPYFTLNYGDLTGSPTIPTATSDLINDSGYITLADVPADVTDRLTSNSAEVVLTGGANPYTTFPAITGGDQLQIQGSEVLSVSGNLALSSTSGLNLIANGSGNVPGGSRNWAFNAQGDLELPTKFPIQFTAVFDAAHYAGGGTFQGDGTVSLGVQLQGLGAQFQWLVDDPTFTTDRGYVGQQAFRYTEADHGITGFNVDILIEMMGPDLGTGLYSLQVAFSPAPGAADLAKIRSTDELIISSGTKGWIFDVQGNVYLPTGGDIRDSTGTSVLNATDFNNFAGDIVPDADNTRSLGSPTRQWKEMYVANGSIYIGNVKLSNNSGKLEVTTVVNPGEVTEEAQGDPFVGGGLSRITTPIIPGTTYKGLKASYGRVHSNGSTNELNVSKIVIHKPANTTTTIDSTSNQDDFRVSGLSSSDVVAMFILYGDVNGPKDVAVLQTFTEAVIDNVILAGGVEGAFNTVADMRSAFYANSAALTTAAGGLYTQFQFYQDYTNATTGVTTVREGSGAVFEIGDNGLGAYTTAGIQSNGTNYLPGHKIKVLGTALGGLTPDNDCIITVDSIFGNGEIFQWSVSGVAAGTVSAVYGPVTGTNYQVGSGFIVAGVGKNGDGTLYANTNSQGSGFVVGDVLTLPGSDLQGGISPDNNITITINSVDVSGTPQGWTATGTFPNIWPYDSISDGGVDQYDTANFISTNITSNINYNGGQIVADGVAAFGAGSAYSFLYTTGIFGLVVTGNSANYVETTGNSGADGGSTTDTGDIYAPDIPAETFDNAVKYINIVNSKFIGSAVNFVHTDNGDEVDVLIPDSGVGALESIYLEQEQVWVDIRDADAASIAPETRPWAGLSSGDAFSLIITYTTPDGVLPPPIDLQLRANNAISAYVAWQNALATFGPARGVGITRDGNNGIYNPYREGSWDSDVSPGGIGWNIDGWADLSDVESRTYTNLYAAFGFGGLGNKIVGTECVIYLPDNGKYYTVKFSQWTQGGNGGGFAYTRRELDLTSLVDGIRFSDGTRLTSAEGVGRVKLESPGARRIEEVSGYKNVSLTAVTPGATQSTTIRQASNSWDFYINADANLDTLYNTQNTYRYLEFSFDGGNSWVPVSFGGGQFGVYYQMVFEDNINRPVVADAVVAYRTVTGGLPVVWWSAADLPGGSSNFRGAVIDYHAFTSDGTIIGTIHIVDDDGEENITHTEVGSGGSGLEHDDLWFVQNEGTISYRRIDGAGRTLKVQWTAKVFYGSEIYD